LISHNLFGYCINDPINLNDPNGTNPFSDFIGGVWSSVVEFVNETNRRGWKAIYEPSPYNITDYLTSGLVSKTDKAFHPEKAFSAEHWKDSFDSALGWASLSFSTYSFFGGTTIFNTGAPILANAPTYGYGSLPVSNRFVPKIIRSKIFSANDGHGLKIGKNFQMFYRNPNAKGGLGGTFFSYKDINGIMKFRLRLDWDPKHGFHFHPPGH
jgi:hypothetical protein